MDILVEPSGREKAKVRTMKRFRYYQYYLNLWIASTKFVTQQAITLLTDEIHFELNFNTGAQRGYLKCRIPGTNNQ